MSLGYREAAAHSGVTYRQLDYWTRVGYLRTDDRVVSVRGRRRMWPESEIRVARRMAALVASGLSVSRAAQVARTGEFAPGIGVVFNDEKLKQA